MQTKLKRLLASSHSTSQTSMSCCYIAVAKRSDLKGDPSDEHAHAFAVGAFFHGGVVGIRERTFHIQQVAALLCRFVQQFLTQPFRIVSLFQGIDASLHMDSHSHPTVPNLLLQLSLARVRSCGWSHLMVVYFVLETAGIWRGAC